jgi:predicted nucleic acid-binding protein
MFYSKITRKELLSIAGISDAEKKEYLLDYVRLIGISSEIASRAAELIDEYGIEVSDALLAATALNKKLILTTRNLKHYKMIEGIEIYNLEE